MTGESTMRAARSAVGVALVLVAGASCRAQENKFLLDVSIPCCSSGEHMFGWVDAGDAGVDPYDLPEPPFPPGQYISAAFQIPGAADPNRWRRDLRATADFAIDLRETWALVLSTNTSPVTCDLTITSGDGDTSRLWLVFAGAYEDTLQLPVNISFELPQSETQLSIEVVDESLPVGATTWGAVKHMYE